MTEAQNKESSQWWWLESNSKMISNRSPWLQSTFADLDKKTKGMLEIIDADADSFARRAEMFYKKKPELISLIQDLYRSHRSLAEQYDHHTKPDLPRVLTPWSSMTLTTKCHVEKCMSFDDKAYDSYSDATGPEESELDEPEEEEEVLHEDHQLKYGMHEVPSFDVNKEEIERLRDQVDKLRTENMVQTEQLKQKDEEKREVIRQLSIAMDILRDENEKLRKSLSKNTHKKETNKPKEGFLGRLLNGFANWPVLI